MASNIPRIVVVGGGAGGLELVTRLGKSLGKKGLAKVYLCDGTPTHIWKPLLHEVATGTLNVGEDELNYFTHAFRNGYRFHFGFMNGLDRERKVIKLDTIKDLEGNVVYGPRELAYDKLVIAVGSMTNDFGVPGVGEHCMTLNSQKQAERLRKRFLGAALALAFKTVPDLKIGIVGAGPTGIELATYIHHTLSEIKAYGARIKSKDLKISILEAAPDILPGTPPHMQEFSAKILAQKGIDVKLNCQITGITDKGFQLKDGSLIEKQIRIWTAGIKAPDWIAEIGLEVDRINRIMINQYLESSDSSIFAIGDCCHAKDPNDNSKILPGTAQLAHQMAEWLAMRIRNDVKNKRTRKPFVYNSQGILVSLGEDSAVGQVSGLLANLDHKVKGRSAKALYASLYRMHQAAIYGNMRAACIYAGDKLRGISMPQVKLH